MFNCKWLYYVLAGASMVCGVVMIAGCDAEPEMVEIAVPRYADSLEDAASLAGFEPLYSNDFGVITSIRVWSGSRIIFQSDEQEQDLSPDRELLPTNQFEQLRLEWVTHPVVEVIYPGVSGSDPLIMTQGPQFTVSVSSEAEARQFLNMPSVRAEMGEELADEAERSVSEMPVPVPMSLMEFAPEAEEVKIRDTTATLYKGITAKVEYYLAWEENGYLLQIQGSDPATMIQLAESLNQNTVPAYWIELLPLNVVNMSGHALCSVYIMPHTQRFWDGSLLQGGAIQPNTSATLPDGVIAGTYDMKFEDCNGNLVSWIDDLVIEHGVPIIVAQPTNYLMIENQSDEAVCNIFVIRDEEGWQWDEPLFTYENPLGAGESRSIAVTSGLWHLYFYQCDHDAEWRVDAGVSTSSTTIVTVDFEGDDGGSRVRNEE